MKQRVLSMLCVVATLLGMVTVPAYATEAATNGSNSYSGLQEAVDAYVSGVIQLAEDAADITVTKDTYIDLNGHSIAGVTVTGGTLYCVDSQTDDYTVADGNYGKVTGVTGTVAAEEGYLAITEAGAVSFHRVDLQLRSMSLRPGNVGVYYSSAFAGDEMVAAAVETYGIALSVAEEPAADNLETLCGYSAITGFAAGANANAANGTLLTGIMSADHSAEENAANAAMPVYGRAYIKTAQGYTFGTCVARDLQTQVEAIDGVWSALSETQKSGVLAMYDAYKAAMEGWNIPNIRGNQLGDTVIKIPVESENGVVTETVTVEQDGVSVTIPFGTLLEAGATELTLNVTRKAQSDSGIEAADDQTLMPFDVHVEGVSPDNTVPLTVALGKVMPENLNMGNYSVYHVEENGTNAMELVANDAEFTAHNQYKYTLDGELTLHMATFSEVAMVTENDNAWNGDENHDWYDADAEELEIRNADQLWSFSQIVGGMAEGFDQDSFSGKTVKLLADIDLGDKEENNDPDKIFYPIGYNCSDGKYEKTSEAVTSGFYTFEGVFDGNGNTIKNFYQNTWEMKGDHDWYDAELQYFRDGMGLFGKVYGGTVKNLTVENFSSDGEITTTGVIAAYADSYEGQPATFENIAITNSNPRVYNIGNGGIVGCAGWYSRNTTVTDAPITFKNITVDQTNKISALWGTYDVSCGGILGQYYPDSGCGIQFENCHVAAIMDVYNDVCANYQYYWYRYCGMLIGTVRANKTEGGYTVADTTGITATDCTYTLGDWNEYWYCELVKNSLASYTHDHQFSRLTKITSVSEIQDANGNWNQEGNFVIPAADNSSATCYHIFKDSEGNLYQHFHDVADETNTEVYETVNGEKILKEDRQCYFMPFNQVLNGLGYGVKAHYAFAGMKEVENGTVKAEQKFAALNAVTTYVPGEAITLGELFESVVDDTKLSKPSIFAAVSPVAENGVVSATYALDLSNWENSTLTFSEDSVDMAKVIITDYFYCTPTEITMVRESAQQEPVEKFAKKFENESFMYRVGNHAETPVALSSLFEQNEGYSGTIDSANVSVTVEGLSSAVPEGIYTADATTWSNGKLDFSGYTGVVRVTITEDESCTPTELLLEVVDAKNATAATSATANNVVLLNDVTTSSTKYIKNGYAIYGNGFTITCSGKGTYSKKDLKRGYIEIESGGMLADTQVICDIFPESYIFTSELTAEPYDYQYSAVTISGEGSKVENCYIYGARNNLCIMAGNVTVEDTVLECGSLANIHIYQSNSDYTVTLRDLTTIQKPVPSEYDSSAIVMGFGVLVGTNESTTNPKIVLEGDLRQYNWVNSTHCSGDNQISNKYGRTAISSALEISTFQYVIDNVTTVNMGIAYLNEATATIEDNRTNQAAVPYYLDSEVSISGKTGQVYSVLAGSSEITASSRYDAEVDGVISYTEEGAPLFVMENNILYAPQFRKDSTLGGQYVKGTDELCYYSGDTVKVMFPSDETRDLDLTKLADIAKYSGQDLGLVIECSDSAGNAMELTNGVLTITHAGDYTVTYTVEDTVFYDLSGETVEKVLTYSWEILLSVSLKDTNIPDAYFAYDTSKRVIYADPTNWLGNGDYKQYIPFLAGLKIYDYIGKTAYLRFDGDADFNKIAKASINNVNTTGQAQGYHIVTVELVDGGKLVVDMDVRATSGSSTHTGSICVSNNVLYVVNGGTTSAKGQLWKIYSYKFVGNNGTEINSGAITFGTDGTDATTGTAPSTAFSASITATVTYETNGGMCGQTVGYTTGNYPAVTLPTPTYANHVFNGWYTAATGGDRIGGAGDSYTPSGDITLYAQWGEPCEVSYDANGGVCAEEVVIYNGILLTLPEPTNEGYWFMGWYTEPDGGGRIGGAGDSYTPTADITLYAQWSENYTVGFAPNGGTCDTVSLTYKGTALVLPVASNGDKALAGWFTAAEGGEMVGTAGDPYTPTENVVLYAQWQDPVTVTYDPNGGTCATESQIYTSAALVLPTPSRTGCTFSGWYTAATGGTKIGDARASYSPTANITLYAQWEKISYTITYDKSNVSSSTGPSTAYYGDTVTVTVVYSNGQKSAPTVVGATSGTSVSVTSSGSSKNYTYTFTMPAENVTMTLTGSTSCVTPDTLVTLADGSQKEIQYVTYEDELVVWDFVNGCYTTAGASIVMNHGFGEYEIVALTFEDGTVVKTINGHGFYDVEEKKFVILNESNVADFVGHTFIKQNGDGNTTVKLASYEIYTEQTESWSILTAEHYNCVFEGMLTLTPAEVEGSPDYLMPFAINSDLKYDAEAMQADIEKYGLYTYEEFAELLTYEQFVALNLKYFKVSVGKGYITYEDILFLIDLHM